MTTLVGTLADNALLMRDQFVEIIVMGDIAPLVWLTFFTLASGIVVVGGGFLYSLRRKRERRIASHVLLGEDGHRADGVPDGALPELAAVFLFALAMMALLALGYAAR